MNQYIFNDNGVLEVQQIRKYDLAFFYNRCPFAFRKEIENLFIMSFKKKFYTSNEVRKIFAHLGDVTRADVENAQLRIKEYKRKLRMKYRNKILNK